MWHIFGFGRTKGNLASLEITVATRNYWLQLHGKQESPANQDCCTLQNIDKRTFCGIIKKLKGIHLDWLSETSDQSPFDKLWTDIKKNCVHKNIVLHLLITRKKYLNPN